MPSMKELLHTLKKRRKKPDQRTQRRFRIISLATVTALAVIATPVARPLGYSLADGLCSQNGCTAAVGSMPLCSGVGRDKAVSATLMSFSTSIAAQTPTQLAGFVDGRVRVTTNANTQNPSIFEFSNEDQAKRFVFDNSARMPHAIDAGAGPTAGGTYNGFVTLLTHLGLINKDLRDPRATATRYGEPGGKQGQVVHDNTNNHTTLTYLTPLPSPDTPSLNRFAAILGITGVLNTQVTRAPDGSLQSLTFAGPAAQAWNLGVLQTSDFTAAQQTKEIATFNGGFVVRSYALDLTQSSNATAYQDLVTTEQAGNVVAESLKTGLFDLAVAKGSLERNPYQHMRDRIRDTAVITETRTNTNGANGPRIDNTNNISPLVELYARYTLAYPVASGMDVQSITAADLALPGAQLQPFVTCQKDS